MYVKTYQGKTTRDVMARIKEELGSDAVILSTQTKTVKGEKCCEVMAALETTPSASGNGSAGTAPSGQEAIDWQAIQKEWAELRDQCLSVLRPKMDLNQLPSKQRQVIEYLEKEGVSSRCLFTIWKRLTEDTGHSSLSVLGTILKTISWNNTPPRTPLHAFAGPYGSGKTSTILKLALRFKKNHPSSRICIANGDHNHAKGRLFLKHYADISGFFYRDITTKRDWRNIAGLGKEYDLVLIDLPGLTSGQSMGQWIADECPGIVNGVKFHLLLSPLYAPAQQDMFVKRFSLPNTTSIIWTKLDEACTYGDLVTRSYITGLPVSLLSFGPSLRNSIAEASPKNIWPLLFKHELPSAS